MFVKSMLLVVNGGGDFRDVDTGYLLGLANADSLDIALERQSLGVGTVSIADDPRPREDGDFLVFQRFVFRRREGVPTTKGGLVYRPARQSRHVDGEHGHRSLDV
jgi:hypothetical protein